MTIVDNQLDKTNSTIAMDTSNVVSYVVGISMPNPSNKIETGFRALWDGTLKYWELRSRGYSDTLEFEPWLKVGNEFILFCRLMSRLSHKNFTCLSIDSKSEIESAKCSDNKNLEIVLAYYPPYHSKYNSIERCWGILENHWSGTLLNTIETTLEWAKTMTWKGFHPVVKLVETTYQKGIRMGKKAFKVFASRVDRDRSLPMCYMTIQPQV